MENIVIGIINISKIRKAEGITVLKGIEVKDSQIPSNNIENLGKLVLSLFFLFHYGMFTFGHGIFIFAIFGFPHQSFIYILITFISIFISHFISYKINYIGKGEYISTSPGQLFKQPYNRIFITHITIVIGGIFVQKLGSPIYALIIMIILKIILDLGLHNREHKKFEGSLSVK